MRVCVCMCVCVCMHVCVCVLQDGDEVDQLEKDLEIQSSIIEASRVSVWEYKFSYNNW